MNKDVKNLYNTIGGEKYNKRGFSDRSFRIKSKILEQSTLTKGSKVLVPFCGSGQDFAPILNIIGTTGEIVGVDFSAAMLEAAQKNIERDGIKNVTLIEADVCTFNQDKYHNYFDAVFCSMGIASLDEPQEMYGFFDKFLKPKSETIIFDLKCPSSFFGKAFYLMMIERITKKYGGNRVKHAKSEDLYQKFLSDSACRESKQYFFGSFYSVLLRRD